MRRRNRTYLNPDKYSRILSIAGTDPLDYAILQVFLQTGRRVSELCDLKLPDADLDGRTITVSSGKGTRPTILSQPDGMKFLMDQNFDRRPVPPPRQHGHDVTVVGIDYLSSADDILVPHLVRITPQSFVSTLNGRKAAFHESRVSWDARIRQNKTKEQQR